MIPEEQEEEMQIRVDIDPQLTQIQQQILAPQPQQQRQGLDQTTNWIRGQLAQFRTDLQKKKMKQRQQAMRQRIAQQTPQQINRRFVLESLFDQLKDKEILQQNPYHILFSQEIIQDRSILEFTIPEFFFAQGRDLQEWELAQHQGYINLIGLTYQQADGVYQVYTNQTNPMPIIHSGQQLTKAPVSYEQLGAMSLIPFIVNSMLKTTRKKLTTTIERILQNQGEQFHTSILPLSLYLAQEQSNSIRFALLFQMLDPTNMEQQELIFYKLLEKHQNISNDKALLESSLHLIGQLGSVERYKQARRSYYINAATLNVYIKRQINLRFPLRQGWRGLVSEDTVGTPLSRTKYKQFQEEIYTFANTNLQRIGTLSGQKVDLSRMVSVTIVSLMSLFWTNKLQEQKVQPVKMQYITKTYKLDTLLLMTYQDWIQQNRKYLIQQYDEDNNLENLNIKLRIGSVQMKSITLKILLENDVTEGQLQNLQQGAWIQLPAFKRFNVPPMITKIISSAHYLKGVGCLLECLYHLIGAPVNPKLEYATELTKLGLNELSQHTFKNPLEIQGLVSEGDTLTLVDKLRKDEKLQVDLYVFHSRRLIYSESLAEEDDSGKVVILVNGHAMVTTFGGIKKLEAQLAKRDLKDRQKQWKLKPVVNKPQVNGGVLFWDIETFKDVELKCVPYLVCLTGSYKGEEVQLSFQGLDCLAQLADWFFERAVFSYGSRNRTSKNEANVYVWGYNSSRFDNILLLPYLTDLSHVETTGKTTELKEMIFGQFLFRDLCLLTPGYSLRNLARKLDLNTQKGDFDHEKVAAGTWQQHIEEATQYCLQDCLTLQACYKWMRDKIQTVKHNGKQLTGELVQMTIGQLAMRVYQQLFLKYPVVGSPVEILSKERKSYKGGMVQIFYPKSKQSYYYDINSSFPHQMFRHSMPLYNSERCVTETGLNATGITKLTLYLADVKFPADFLYTFIGQRVKGKGLIYPSFVQKQWIWGEELLLVQKYVPQAVITTYEYIRYNNSYPIFKQYVDKVYRLKRESKQNADGLTLIYKLLLNNLYGKFGQQYFPKQILTDAKHILEFQLGNTDQDMWKITEVDFGEGHKKMIEATFMQVDPNTITFQVGSLVRISSYIAMQGRCQLISTMMDEVQRGNKVFYMDTDSLVLEKPMTTQRIHPTLLGCWALEQHNSAAIFLQPKMYMMIPMDIDKEINVKSKGVFKQDQFKLLLQLIGEKKAKMIEVLLPNMFVRSQGQVSIKTMKKRIHNLWDRRKRLFSPTQKCWRYIPHADEAAYELYKSEFFETIRKLHDDLNREQNPPPQSLR